MTDRTQIDDSVATIEMVERTCEAFKDELESAMQKHLGFPADPIHQASIVAEEGGEALKAALEAVYEGADPAEIDKELIQTGAMAIRALVARQIQRREEKSNG